MTTFSNLKAATWNGVDKQKAENSKIFFVIITKKSSLFHYYFTIAIMIWVVSFIAFTKNDQFCDLPHLLPEKWAIDLLFESNRICKHVSNFQTPPLTPFCVDVINVWSLVRCRSNYYGETTIPAFSFPTKHDKISDEKIRFNIWEYKSKIIRFVTHRQPTHLCVIYISHFEETFLKIWQKGKESSTNKFVKTCAKYCPKYYSKLSSS